MSDNKKANMFAKLGELKSRAEREEAAAENPPATGAVIDTPPPSPAPGAPPKAKPAAVRKKAEPVTGKRGNPDYCQANAYVPKAVRRSVDKVLLDMDDMDYSTLITELLKKWLKSRGVAE